MERALLVTLMCVVAVSDGSTQTRSAADGPWSGWVRCELSAQLNEQGRSYLNQQTHTWELTASTPTSGTDIKEYPATWTVVGGGTGQRQEGIGRTVADKWNTSGQPMSTTISFRVDLTGALFIALRGAQLASVGATTGQSVAQSTNAPGQQTSIRLSVDEYRFPLIRDDATKTGIAGSSGPVAIGNIAPGQPPRTVSTAACSWNFVRGGEAPPPPTSGRSMTRDQAAPVSPVSGLTLPGTAPPSATPSGRTGSDLGRTNTGLRSPLPAGTTPNPVDPGNLIGTAAKWWGWARCTLTTTGPDNYSEQQAHTWTLTGAAPTVAEASVATYPATWSLAVRGSSAKNMGAHPGSLPGGDVEYRDWSTDVERAAPIAVSGSIGSPRVSFTAAHAPLQEVVTITRFIGNPDGTQLSPTSLGNLAMTIGETAFPLIQASGTRISGSSTPAADAPAGFSRTASCSWLFDHSPLLTADAPPPPPKTRALPPNIAQRIIDLQKVRVLMPNGSEDWAMNTARQVIWEHKLGVGKRFDIDLSVDGGSAWVSLARNVADDGSGSRGAYEVMMPRYGSVAALIRVSPAGDTPNGDVSDGAFRLGEAWLRMDAPNGETVRWGNAANFRTTSNLGMNDRYTIEISYNNGQNWYVLAESAPSGSTFVVPRTTQTNNGFAQIRATSHTVPTLRALGSLRLVY
jgi:hypothetical protein